MRPSSYVGSTYNPRRTPDHADPSAIDGCVPGNEHLESVRTLIVATVGGSYPYELEQS